MKSDPKTVKPNQGKTGKKSTPDSTKNYPKRETDPNNPVAGKDKKGQNNRQRDSVTNVDRSVTNADKSRSDLNEKAE